MTNTPEETQIDNIRLAVLRVVHEIGSQRTSNVRSIEIYRHTLVRDEEGKRIGNALFQMKRADPALLLMDVSGNYELTAAGLQYLDRHKDVPLDREPVPERRMVERRLKNAAADPPAKEKKRPEGSGSRVNDPAAGAPSVTASADPEPLYPGRVMFVPDGKEHIHKTIAELEARQVKLEELLRGNQQAIEALKRLAQGSPI